MIPTTDVSDRLRNMFLSQLLRFFSKLKFTWVVYHVNLSKFKNPLGVNTEEVRYVKITYIGEIDGYHDVYCFNEPFRHMGMFNGILTGNCTEIMELCHSRAYNLLLTY